MKKFVPMSMLFLFIALHGYAQSNNYQQANGTILESKTDGNINIIVRKYDQRIQIGDIAMDKNLHVYSQPDRENSRELFKLNLGDYINISELLKKENTKDHITDIWLKITTEKGRMGWIYYSASDPYENDNWAVMEIITVNNRTWTVRKLEQSVAFWDALDVRNTPGLDGSIVLFTLSQDENNSQINVDTISITEEQDTIDGITDSWIKIRDEQGRIGWIFGGYATVERGGPKYLIPENDISFSLGYY